MRYGGRRRLASQPIDTIRRRRVALTRDVFKGLSRAAVYPRVSHLQVAVTIDG